MTANKMPEMPEANVRFVALTHDIHFADSVEVPGETLDLYTADQMRAMYLAGIAAAREAVAYGATASTHGTDATAAGWNSCRELTLANLSALEQGVGK